MVHAVVQTWRPDEERPEERHRCAANGQGRRQGVHVVEFAEDDDRLKVLERRGQSEGDGKEDLGRHPRGTAQVEAKVSEAEHGDRRGHAHPRESALPGVHEAYLRVEDLLEGEGESCGCRQQDEVHVVASSELSREHGEQDREAHAEVDQHLRVVENSSSCSVGFLQLLGQRAEEQAAAGPDRAHQHAEHLPALHLLFEAQMAETSHDDQSEARHRCAHDLRHHGVGDQVGHRCEDVQHHSHDPDPAAFPLAVVLAVVGRSIGFRFSLTLQLRLLHQLGFPLHDEPDGRQGAVQDRHQKPERPPLRGRHVRRELHGRGGPGPGPLCGPALCGVRMAPISLAVLPRSPPHASLERAPEWA
mmetsp:Transcript_43309/g.94262  ORF Transcript_43309/g.94262 Transcript_43309/m.94262 type:complete len:359 (-) Transcript_43309:2-1078(-)